MRQEIEDGQRTHGHGSARLAHSIGHFLTHVLLEILAAKGQARAGRGQPLFSAHQQRCKLLRERGNSTVTKGQRESGWTLNTLLTFYGLESQYNS